MRTNEIQVSIIIVHYKVEKELLACVNSIFNSKPKTKFEIIIIDNDQESGIKGQLKQKFPQVKYVRNSGNIGFGPGNNVGAKLAIGNYLFFLNPDTIVGKDSIDELFNFIEGKSNIGMVAPLLLDPSGNVYPMQGSDEYDFESAMVTSSFVNKIFPNNSISEKFFHKKWDKKDIEEFGVVPGTAFIITKNLFNKVGKFDENLFLYFEEYDLAKRVNKLGYKNYIIPKAKVIHEWEKSTKKRNDIKKIFAQSRNYFFKKNYGNLFSLVINLISNLGKYEILLSLITILSLVLGLFRIRETMAFIGDQGWFYLSARDMLVDGQIPLVGIASSHPWLHQGPLWTYLLAPFLWLFEFDPVSGAYLTVILGTLSVVGIYIVGSRLFSKQVGLIASLLYATSPLVVFYTRFPYHTSPIPFFVIGLIYFLYKLAQGSLSYLPITFFLLIILYNLEIATVALWGVLAVILIYVFIVNKNSFKLFLNKKNIILSFFSIAIPLSPIILYDIENGFSQTLKFGAWVPYKVFSFFSFGGGDIINDLLNIINFLAINFSRLIFASSNIISLIIFISLIFWMFYFVFKNKIKSISHDLVILLLIIPVVAIILTKTPSDAYLPMLFPAIILLVSLFFAQLIQCKNIKIPIIILLMLIVLSNINYMLKNDFYFDTTSSKLGLSNRILASKKILDMAGNKSYNLIGKGGGSEFKSFTMNYEYLTWWMGHGPSKEDTILKISVSENLKGIKIENK